MLFRSEELYGDLLGGKHFKEFSKWSLNVAGSLYDAVRYSRKQGPNEGLEGLGLDIIDNGTVFSEYGSGVPHGGALIVINLNLRAYRN